MLEKMRKLAVDESAALAGATRKLEWKQYQDGIRKKSEDKEEEERNLMQSIDWHDFVVVETIEFHIDEEVRSAQYQFMKLLRFICCPVCLLVSCSLFLIGRASSTTSRFGHANAATASSWA